MSPKPSERPYVAGFLSPKSSGRSNVARYLSIHNSKFTIEQFPYPFELVSVASCRAFAATLPSFFGAAP